MLARSAETRAAYVASVSDACGSDVDFRRAAIEALLLLPSDRAVDFVQFAVTRLAHPSDKGFITDLTSHPDRLVQYAAEAVRRVAFGSNLGQETALPSAGSTMLENLTTIGINIPDSQEPPRTWLADRTVERLIERTVGSVEARFAKEYLDHSEEGEEKLLAMMFEALSAGFTALDQSLDAIARAASSPRRSTVTMRYRTVDKAEEGAPGIKRAGSFSQISASSSILSSMAVRSVDA